MIKVDNAEYIGFYPVKVTVVTGRPFKGGSNE
jgi:hypothetical protein